MKTIATLVLALSASTALACPNLTGSYLCQNSQGSGVVEVSQVEENGVTTYTIGGDVMIADGIEKDYNDGQVVGVVSTYCEGEMVVSTLNGDLLENGQDVGDLEMKQTIGATADGIEAKTSGTYTYGNQSGPIEETISCVTQ